MKQLLIASLVAAQLSSTPAFAASLEEYSSITSSRRGAFAGARVRVPFGGSEHGKARAGLTVAPTMRGDSIDTARTRFGEGAELSFAADEPLTFRLGGAPLDHRFNAAGRERDIEAEKRTGKKILKGLAVVGIVAAAVVGGLILFVVVACDGNRCSE